MFGKFINTWWQFLIGIFVCSGILAGIFFAMPPTKPATENANDLPFYSRNDMAEIVKRHFEEIDENDNLRQLNQELSSNLTAAQARITELESRPIPTVTVTVTPPPVTVEVPTIPPDVTVLWQADGSSDNLTYSEFYTLQQVEDYIASCNLTTVGNCYEWMMALAERARHDGKPIGLALMFKQRADGAITEAHFTNFVIIGKKVLRIEPQTGQISNWDGWRLAIP